MKTALRSVRVLVLLFLSFLVAVLLIINVTMKEPHVDEIKIVTPPSIIASLPHWIAQDLGLYARENLKVTSVDVTSSPLMMQALGGGDGDVLPAVSLVDVINGSASLLRKPLIFSHSRMTNSPPFDAIIVMRGSSLATIKNLEGASVAVYPGATAQAALSLYLKNNGVDTSTIKFHPLPPPEHLRALERGDVVAAFVYEPIRTQALANGLCRELSGSVYASFSQPSGIGVSVLSSQFATEKPEVVAKYLKVWDEAVQIIRTKPGEARAILGNRLGLSPEVASAATWVDATLVSELDQQCVRSTAKSFKDMGLIQSDEALDSMAFYGVK